MGLSYQYSLANKYFDYIMAGIPQLCIDFTEYRRANNEFEVAILVKDLARDTLKVAIEKLVTDQDLYGRLKAHTEEARKHYNWDVESRHLQELYEGLHG